MTNEKENTEFFKQMKQFLAWAFNGLVAVRILIILHFYILFLGDEDDRDLFDPVCIGNSIIVFEMKAFMDVI